MLSVRAPLLCAIAALGACYADPVETTHGGSVRQLVTQVRLSDPRPTRLLFIVDGSPTPEAARVRADLVRAVEEATADLVPRVPSTSRRWVPVDIDARVLWIGDRTVRSAAEDARLRWHEEDASDGGASTFVRGVADAVTGPLPPEADASRALETLRMALQLTPPEQGWRRTVVVATSRDDPAARAVRESGLEAEDYPSLVTLFPTDEREERCSDETRRWQLMQWLAQQHVDVFFACRGQHMIDPGVDSGMRKLTGQVATNPDGTPACRVRVRVPAEGSTIEERCDPRRGWIVPTESAPSLDTATVTCDVTMLDGEDGARCRGSLPAATEAASGWCLVDEPYGRLAGPWLRFTGGAAPAGAEVEIACNLRP